MDDPLSALLDVKKDHHHHISSNKSFDKEEEGEGDDLKKIDFSSLKLKEKKNGKVGETAPTAGKRGERCLQIEGLVPSLSVFTLIIILSSSSTHRSCY